MHIAFVLEYYPPHFGGIQIVFQNVATRLVDRGHEVTVVTSQTGETDRREKRDGVPIRRCPVVQSLDRYTFTVTGIPEAIRTAREADVIHTSTWTGTTPAWIASLATDTPAICTVHEVFEPIWELTDRGRLDKALHRLLERAVFALPFEQYTTVSEYTRDCLREQGKHASDIEVVYNGIDNELFDPTAVEDGQLREIGVDAEFVFMYFGRPGFSKGVEYLVEAAPDVFEQVPDSHLLLILGDKPRDRYAAIQDRIDELGIRNDVTILNPVEREQLPQYVGNADCVVVPSLSEGFGFTAAEACALEVPVVTTSAGSLPEVVSGEHVTVEPANATALADGIARVARGEADFQDRRTFEWEDAVDRYLTTYRKLMD